MITRFRSIFAATVLVLLLSLVVRFYQLAGSLPVFADEAIYVRWAQVMRVDETLRFLPLSDGKQPLYMWAIIPFLKLFSDPLLAGRALSALSGVGTVILVGLVAFRLFKSAKTALLAATLAAVSPFLVFFDREALVDSFLTFWAVLVFLLALLTADNPRLDLALLTGFALGGAWLTKSPGELFFFLLPTVIILTGKERIIKPEFLLKISGSFVVSWFVGLGLYNILRLGPNFHLIASRNLDYVFTFGEVLGHPLFPLLPNLAKVLDWLVLLFPLPLLVVTLAGFLLLAAKKSGLSLLLLLWGVLPIILEAGIAKVFTARYVLFAIPFLIIPASYAVFAKFSHNRLFQTLVLVLVFAPTLFQTFLLAAVPANAYLPAQERNGYLEEWTAGFGLKEIAAYLISQAPQTHFLVGTEGFFGTLPDGLEIYTEGHPNIRITGLVYPIKDVPLGLITALSDNQVYLIANQSRFEIADPKAKGLTLLAAYPRPARPDGTHDTLLFFKVGQLK